MKIKLTTLYVDNQDQAFRFYTEILGFVKKADVNQGPFRWLTVVSAEDPEGTELQLAASTFPPAKAFQEALAQAGQPALLLYTNDVAADCAQIQKRGGELAMPPTDVTGSKIAQVRDPAGNLVQLVQLVTWG